MFNLSGSEIVVILLLALVVLGPEKLPDAMRRAGKAFAEVKKLSSGFQDEVRKGFDEPVREVKKTAATVKSAARMTANTVTGKDITSTDTTAPDTTSPDTTSPDTTSPDTTSPDTTSPDKPRYNPATDPAPEPPEGSSVAAPLEETSPDAAEVTAPEVPDVEPADVDSADPEAVAGEITTSEVEAAPTMEADRTA